MDTWLVNCWATRELQSYHVLSQIIRGRSFPQLNIHTYISCQISSLSERDPDSISCCLKSCGMWCYKNNVQLYLYLYQDRYFSTVYLLHQALYVNTASGEQKEKVEFPSWLDWWWDRNQVNLEKTQRVIFLYMWIWVASYDSCTPHHLGCKMQQNHRVLLVVILGACHPQTTVWALQR